MDYEKLMAIIDKDAISSKVSVADQLSSRLEHVVPKNLERVEVRTHTICHCCADVDAKT